MVDDHLSVPGSVIVYHGGCVDGAMAAAVALRALRARGGDPALFAARYQEPIDGLLPIVAGKEVYVLDFCFPPRETDAIAAAASRVVILDHHKASRERFEEAWIARVGVRHREGPTPFVAYFVGRDRPEKPLDFEVRTGRLINVEVDFAACEGPCVTVHPHEWVRWFPELTTVWSNVGVVFDMDRSGASMAWDYFNSSWEGDRPILVQHVEDYDIWRHRLPASRAVHAYLRSHDMDVEVFAGLLEATMPDSLAIRGAWSEIEGHGAAIYRANRQQAALLASDPEEVTFGGVTALAANAPLHQDDVGEILGGQAASGVGVAWYWRGGRYKVSLRSRSVDGQDPVDCSAIARLYGGGGHRQSASFYCDELPWRSR
jgi:hypothetical protein